VLLGGLLFGFAVLAAVVPVSVEYGFFLDYHDYDCGSVVAPHTPAVPNRVSLEYGTLRRVRVQADCRQRRATARSLSAGLLITGALVLVGGYYLLPRHRSRRTRSTAVSVG
jgi:hypothetical protein